MCVEGRDRQKNMCRRIGLASHLGHISTRAAFVGLFRQSKVKFAAFLTQAEGRKRQRERERDRDGGRRERWGEERVKERENMKVKKKREILSFILLK